jgi:outer membrane protein TolC
VLLARHLAEVAKNALAESQAFAERTRLLFQQGEAARADVVKAEAQAAFLSQSVTAAELDAETANHELASFWTAEVADRLPLRDVLEEAPPAPPPPAPSPAGGLFLRRPELGLLDAERSGFLADAKRARAERRPQASLMFQYGLDSVRLDAADHGYAAFLSLDIPVFDWFRGRKAARQLELQAERIENSRNVLERALSREYQDALSRVRMIHAQIETARSQVALSEQDLRLSRVRYEGGEGSALDVVAAQNQLAQARTNYYTALARYLESRADLAVASGEPLP